MHQQMLAAFALYFFVLITIGLLASRRQKSAADFILGGRSLNYWVAGIAANASDMSVWLFMGLPMMVFVGGAIHAWTAIGLILFMFLNWHIVAPRLRIATEKYNSLTLFTYFERRLKDEGGSLRLVSAIWSIVFLSIYIAVGLVGIGYLFEWLFGINYHLGCVLAIGAVIIYTYLGGFAAIAWTDFFQGIFLLFVAIFVPVLALSELGDFSVLSLAATKKGLSTSLMPDFSTATISKILTLSLGWGLGYFGQPHILNKFMAVKNPSEIKKSKIVSTLWQIFALGASALAGLVAIAYLSDPPANEQLVVVEMVRNLFNPFFAGLALCAILAATLSSMDSQILVLASVMAEDIYKKLINKDASSKQIMKASRVSVLIIAGTALAIALNTKQTIFELVNYCWVGLGCAFGPIVILCLYSKTINKHGALVGMLVGGSIGALWNFLGFEISAMIPGFASGMAVTYLVSLLTGRRMVNS